MTEQTPPSGWQPPPGDPRAAAKAAKAYAKATRPWYKKKRFILPLGLVVLVVLGSALGGGGGDDGADTASDSDTSSQSSAPTSESTTEAAPTSEEAEPSEEAKPTEKAEPKPVAVKASAMIQEFLDNELAADKKYNGKVVKVTGVVDKIDTDLFDSDKYVLRLGGGSDFELQTVNCNDMSTDELSTIGKGDTVTVIGDFDDGGDLGIEVKDCKLA